MAELQVIQMDIFNLRPVLKWEGYNTGTCSEEQRYHLKNRSLKELILR